MNIIDINQATTLIQHGGIIAYPTEAVYGLGCDPRNEKTVMRLLILKQRDVSKGLIVVVSDWSQLQDWIEALTHSDQLRLAQTSRPTTWLMPKTRHTPNWLTGKHSSLAVRLSQHPVVNALCQACGALVSTSANISHTPPARAVYDVQHIFAQHIDGIVAGELGHYQDTSAICDFTTGAWIRS